MKLNVKASRAKLAVQQKKQFNERSALLYYDLFLHLDPTKN